MLCPTSRLPFLTKIHLTPRALRELNRWNNLPGDSPTCTELIGVSSSDLSQFTRHGGPDLRHLRAVRLTITRRDLGVIWTNPVIAPRILCWPLPHSFHTVPFPSQSQRPHSTDETSLSSETRPSPAHNFEQHLIYHKIHPDGYEFPDGRSTPEPSNMDSVQHLPAA